MEEVDWKNVDSAEQQLYFFPEKDNVIFTSALHGSQFLMLRLHAILEHRSSHFFITCRVWFYSI